MDDGFLQDLFSSVGPISIRKMFGGQGIYADGRIIAVVLSSGDLYVKGDADSAPTYEARGMPKWTYTNTKSGSTSSMPYWRVSETALDDADEMADLARLATETALRAPAKKPKKKRA